MVTQYRTVDFLPEFFNTDTNSEFLTATLDQLVSPSMLMRTQGYIGNKFGYSVNKTDNYVVEPTAQKTNYQLDPAVTFLNKDTQTARDFIDYPDIVNALRVNGAKTLNNNRLFESDFYTWDGFFDIDKLVNFQQYYWLPGGPEAVEVKTTDNTKLNLNTILGTQQYTSPNGVTFTNGLKIIFDQNVLPISYAGREYYVQGVGSSISLVLASNIYSYELADQSNVQDYIVISRGSSDLNAWTRNNYWFHIDVLRATAEYNNTIRATDDLERAGNRATRPIIEFNLGLKLFNGGTLGYPAIDFIDTTQTDAFSNVAGKTYYAPDTANAQTITPEVQDGNRILFAVDSDVNVRSRVYIVRFEQTETGETPVITLTPDLEYQIEDNVQLVAKNGYYNKNATYWYSMENQTWTRGQQKTSTNQFPYFDIFDNNGISYFNENFYPQTTFRGCTLFQYSSTGGTDDAVLGFPVKYSSLNNIGDIQFTVSFESDTFTYTSGGTTVTSFTRQGFVQQYTNREDYIRRIGWVKIPRPTTQYQTFTFVYDGETNTFICNVPAKTLEETIWKNVIVYANNVELDSDRFQAIITPTSTLVTLGTEVSIAAGDPVVVQLISDFASELAYYSIPTNLQNNPFNQNLNTIDFGDIRKQYSTIFTNAPGVTGITYGSNNIRDLGNLSQYGTTIVQHSSSLLLPGLFLRQTDYNLADALNYNALEYEKYKQTLVANAQRIVANLDPNEQINIENILESVISELASTKNTTQSFFWGDMVYWGNPLKTNQYSFNTDTTVAVFPIDFIYNDSSANYNGIAIYLTRTVNNTTTITQLIKGTQYYFDTQVPQVVVTTDILPDDIITVKQYSQTWGSYCPNTPSKMGLYPAWIPQVITQQANPISPKIYFIRGHDGSLTKLWGTYNQSTNTFDDPRDAVLFEFEVRVWNNIKVSGPIPMELDLVVPGQWRTTDYTFNEITEISEVDFLRWAGFNSMDYVTQYYKDWDSYSFNYRDSINRLDNSAVQQGYWRGIYRWLYDTDRPDIRPWEMMGYSTQPDWWTSRYGPVPVTKDNLVLWNDIAAGIDWNDGQPRTVSARARPGILQALPVDSAGNLRSPRDICVIPTQDFNREWRYGDNAPIENAWTTSSSWPFAMMRVLSLTKPAQFYNLCVDVDRYKYNSEFQQYLYDGRSRLVPGNIEVYGNGTSKNSYLNWLVDWGYSRGTDAYTQIVELLSNLDIRLIYKISGFTDKNYLKFYVEKASTESSNTSLLIPDDSYQLLLYNSVPTDVIRYSSVIVQKSGNRWRIWGNDRANSYFTIATPIENGNVISLTNDRQVIIIPADWSNSTINVPYGTRFTISELAQFLCAYGARLTQLGCIFNNIEDGIELSWPALTQRVIDWSRQSWADGTTISVNPSASKFSFNKENQVVQPLGVYGDNYILNENLLPISTSDLYIHRLDTEFTITSLIEEQTIAYTNFAISDIEHAVVFDNTTVFNDVIYKPDTGLRQGRMLLEGNKSSNWNGTMTASGFILNENNVKEWNPDIKYTKGSIVLYKNKYWSAADIVLPNQVFQENQWLPSDYSEIKAGLLSNPSTQSYQSQYYYDIYRANLENDADLLAFSLIGYRPRAFLSDNNLTDITQINIYRNFIKTKGTVNAVEGFKFAKFNQGNVNYDVFENWAIKQADFGAVLSNNYIEFALLEPNITSNPSIITFSTTSTSDEYTQQTVNINSDLVNYMTVPVSANILPEYDGNSTTQYGMPTAGYVKFNQVKLDAYEYSDLNADTDSTNTFYLGDNLWVAKVGASWQVYSSERTNTYVTRVINNYNNTVTVEFNSQHGLNINNLITIANFDVTINGFYTVLTVPSLNTVVIGAVLSPSTESIVGIGTVFKLESARLATPANIDGLWDNDTGFSKKRVWIDTDIDGEWAVYQLDPTYSETGNISNIGASATGPIAISPLGYYVGTTGNVTFYNSDRTRGNTSYDVSIENATDIKVGNIIVVAANSNVATARANDTIVGNITNVPCSGITTINSDDNWIYVVDGANSNINVYYNSGNYNYTLVSNISATNVSTLTASVDGSVLVVGQPNETVNGLTTAGQVSVFTQTGGGIGNINISAVGEGYNANTVIVNITGDGSGAAANANLYANGAIESISITNRGRGYTYANITITGGNSNTATATAANISNITFTLQQIITSPTPQQGALFGHSVATNRWGADIIIGAPYELTTVGTTPYVEGAVYRFTNGGQRYGTANITITGSVANIAINDVFFSAANASNFANTLNAATGRAAPVVATANGNVVSLTVNSTGTVTPYNEINLVITGNTNLNWTPYTQTQKIVEPHSYQHAQFGYTVAVNSADGLIVSSPVAIKNIATTFDYSDDLMSNDTIFDHGSTTFIDGFADSGALYYYDYLGIANETISNTGAYTFGQYINEIPTWSNNALQTSDTSRWGDYLSVRNNTIAVSSPAYYANGNSRITTFENSIRSSVWYTETKPGARVDINKLNSIAIYDSETNRTLSYIDYIDPAQYKILGIARENIDYIVTVDPAGYGGSTITWGSEHVNTIWFNPLNIRLLNYNTDDEEYNATYWAQSYPGSSVDVYVWTENTVTPVDYAGPGEIYSLTDYTTVTKLDINTNSLVSYYYYWIKNSTNIPEGKTVSPFNIAQYILDPLSSGVPFLGPLAPNKIALYNVFDLIEADTSVLHVGYNSSTSEDVTHSNFKLLRANHSSDFLPGLPSVGYPQPSGLYLKLLDSLSGVDNAGNQVPDPNLSPIARFGTNFRPRQTMFTDRSHALQNFVDRVNYIMAQYPLVESVNPTYFNKSGPGWNARDYWELTDWWEIGYSSATKPQSEVSVYAELATLPQTIGYIARVSANASSTAQTYVYTSSGWTRIGLSNGTYKILDTLYTQLPGWDVANWDITGWDEALQDQIRWIVRAVCEQILIGSLAFRRNELMTMLFEYIQSSAPNGTNYLSWLSKTSLIDVSHVLRNLIPYTHYENDNFKLVTDYVNEVKPYHVNIKGFTYRYLALDNYNGAVSDFDLPPQWDQNAGKFVSPRLTTADISGQYYLDDPIWNNSQYSEWRSSYGLSLDTLSEERYVTVTDTDDYISSTDTIISVENAYGIPQTGKIKIDDEIIEYNNIDRYRGLLLDVTRAVDGTVATEHYGNTAVLQRLPTVSVQDGAYGYTEAPTVTVSPIPVSATAPSLSATIDTTGRVTAVTVINSGEGLQGIPNVEFSGVPGKLSKITPVAEQLIDGEDAITEFTLVSGFFNSGDSVFFRTPATFATTQAEYNIGETIIEVNSVNGIQLNSTIYTQTLYFSTDTVVTDIDVVNNTITISEPLLATLPQGITLSIEAPPPPGLTNRGYYWIEDINSGIYRLHTTRHSTAPNDYDGLINPDWGKNVVEISGAIGPDNTLELMPQAVVITQNSPVRENKTVLKYDRTTYRSRVTDWKPNTFYAGIFTDIFKQSSTEVTSAIEIANDLRSLITAASRTTPVVITLDNPSNFITGIPVYIQNVRGMTQINDKFYFLKKISSTEFELYDDASLNEPIFGNNWEDYTGGGLATTDSMLSSAQGLVLPLTNSSQVGYLSYRYSSIVSPAQITGQAAEIYRYGLAESDYLATYYIQYDSIDNTDVYGIPTSIKLKLFTDASLSTPVTMPLTGALNMLIREPFYFDRSIVLFNGDLYRCDRSNNDSEFDYSKWTRIASSSTYINALDRISAFYQPTSNMIGKNPGLLVDGITYPNPIYNGLNFVDRYSEIDINLMYSATTPTQYDVVVSGGKFEDGYGPEELVAGIVKDGVDISVATTPGLLWNPNDVKLPATTPETYLDHSGFNVVSFSARPSLLDNYSISFDNITATPTLISLYVGVTGVASQPLGQIKYHQVIDANGRGGYRVDWVNKKIYITNPSFRNQIFDVVLYEAGGGAQLNRLCSWNYPLQIDETDSTKSYVKIISNIDDILEVNNSYSRNGVYVASNIEIKTLTNLGTLTTVDPHNLYNGDKLIVTNTGGSADNTQYYVTVISDDTVQLHPTPELNTLVSVDNSSSGYINTYKKLVPGIEYNFVRVANSVTKIEFNKPYDNTNTWVSCVVLRRNFNVPVSQDGYSVPERDLFMGNQTTIGTTNNYTLSGIIDAFDIRNIFNISPSVSEFDAVTITTDGAHGLLDGQLISIFNVYDQPGSDWNQLINAKSFYVELITATSFKIYYDITRVDPVIAQGDNYPRLNLVLGQWGQVYNGDPMDRNTIVEVNGIRLGDALQLTHVVQDSEPNVYKTSVPQTRIADLNDVLRVAAGPAQDRFIAVGNNGTIITSDDVDLTPISAAISGITQADPAVVTTGTNHGLSNGNRIVITDVVGMTEVNEQTYFINVTSTTTFELYYDSLLSDPVDSTGYGAYVSGGSITLQSYSWTDRNSFTAASLTSIAQNDDKIVTVGLNGVIRYSNTSREITATVQGTPVGTPTVVNTNIAHNLSDGDTVAFNAATGTRYYIDVTGVSQFSLYTDPQLSIPATATIAAGSTIFASFVGINWVSTGSNLLALSPIRIFDNTNVEISDTFDRDLYSVKWAAGLNTFVAVGDRALLESTEETIDSITYPAGIIWRVIETDASTANWNIPFLQQFAFNPGIDDDEAIYDVATDVIYDSDTPIAITDATTTSGQTTITWATGTLYTGDSISISDSDRNLNGRYYLDVTSSTTADLYYDQSLTISADITVGSTGDWGNVNKQFYLISTQSGPVIRVDRTTYNNGTENTPYPMNYVYVPSSPIQFNKIVVIPTGVSLTERYMIVGNNGQIITATNPQSWTSATSNSTANLRYVAVEDARLTIVGDVDSGYGEIVTTADASTFTKMGASGKQNLTPDVGLRAALAYEDASANTRLMIMGELGTTDITSDTYSTTTNVWYNTRPFLQTIGSSLEISVNGSSSSYLTDWNYTITPGAGYYDGTEFTISFTLQPTPGDIISIIYVDPAYLPYILLFDPTTDEWSVTVNIQVDIQDVIEITSFNRVSQQNLNTQVGLTGNFISRVANVVPTTANSAVVVNTLTADTTIEVDDEVIIYGVPGSSYNQAVKIVSNIANSNTAFTLSNNKTANLGLVNVVSNAVASINISNANAGAGYNPLTTTITSDANSIIPFAGIPVINTIDGRIVELNINAAGTGYDANSNLSLLISGPNSNAAVAYANTDANGNISSVSIVNEGSGYNIYGNTTAITVISANIPTTVANITPVILRDGAITGVTILSRGEGYDANAGGTINLVFNGPNTAQASGTANIQDGLITDVQILERGLGYTPNSNVTVTFNQATGTGTGAVANAVVGSSGRIVNIVVEDAGQGYTLGDVTANVAAPSGSANYENANTLPANVALFAKNNMFELPLNISTPTGTIAYNLDDINRTWVWVNGYHLPYSNVPNDGGYSLIRSVDSSITGTQLLINRPISSADDITILTMAEDSTPGETIFTISLDSDGSSTIRRANPYTRTWLTQPLGLYDDTIYVADVSRVISSQTFYNINLIEDVANGVYVATINGVDTSKIVDVSIGRVSYSDFSYEISSKNSLTITVTLNNTLNVVATVRVTNGNTIKIGGEVIGFTSYDVNNNSITGITRGIDNTVINVETVPTYTLVQSRLQENVMSTQLENSNWYGSTSTVLVNLPLQLSQTPAANFLNNQLR